MASSPLSISPPGESAACRQCGAVIDLGANFCAVCGATAQGESIPDPLVGRVVADRYRIMELIGRGGMGVVYKCEHTRMGKVMAIKLLHGDLARDQEVQRRFRREAQAASKLSHPNTVSIFDFGTSDGLMYLVMEYVSGEDLGRILRTAGHLPPTRVCAIAAQACGSLSEAHEHGIVHRDLKPENLLVSQLRDGRDVVKLLDFGLAKLREGEDRNEITGSGTLIGTPYYMAPEIIRGQSADHRVDIYALGGVIYRAATGVPPYSGSSPVAVLTRHLTDDLVLPSRRRPELNVPPAVDAIVARCMKKDPAERYASIDELRAALLEYLSGEGLSDSLLRNPQPTARHSAVSQNPAPQKSAVVTSKMAVATRNDVEEFERRLRRGRLALWAVAGAAALTAGGAGLLVYRTQVQAAQRPRDAELEPNNTPDRATLIAPDMEVVGRVGERLSSDHGDVDFYRLSDVPPGDWRIRVACSGVPNVDTALELLDEDHPAAIAVADDTGEGGMETLAGFRVTGGRDYYLSVHERVRPGAAPRETISYTYTLRYQLARPAAEEELEPDDREEIAAQAAVGDTRRGYVEAAADADFFCLSAQTGRVRVRLEPPNGDDLELVVHPRNGAPETVVDEARAGGAETAVLPSPEGGRPACVVVRNSGGRRADAHGDPERTYTLRFEAAP